MEILFNSQQVGVQCPEKVNHLEITELSKSTQHTADTSCTLRNGEQDNSPWFKAEPQIQMSQGLCMNLCVFSVQGS